MPCMIEARLRRVNRALAAVRPGVQPRVAIAALVRPGDASRGAAALSTMAGAAAGVGG